jgi:DNA-binding NtrC family response regulator
VEEVPILEEEEESTELRGGNETILLVDDEEVVRNLGLSTLKRFGYRVFLAEDGIQATEIYKKKHKSINLIILDLTMPKKSGRETLSDLLKINPKVKVIISSGFDHGGPVDELLKMGAKGFIQKPYKLAQMLNSIRSILDAGK